jgi:hypothetical protein
MFEYVSSNPVQPPTTASAVLSVPWPTADHRRTEPWFDLCLPF